MATNEVSDTVCDGKEVSSRAAFSEELNGTEHETIIPSKSSADASSSGPASPQENTTDMSESTPSPIEQGDESGNSSDSTDGTSEKDDESWGVQRAWIEVGYNGKGLYIDAQLLKSKIPFFQQVFNSARLNYRARYPKLDLAGLELLSKWVYGTPIAEQKRDACRTSELFSLYVCASHFKQEELQEETIECIFDEVYGSCDESRFTPEHVKYAYEKTPGLSTLQFFCAGAVAEAMEEDNKFEWDRSQISMLLAALPQLRLNINPPALRRFGYISTAAHNVGSDHEQLIEVDDDIEPVHDKFGSALSAGFQSCGTQIRYGFSSDEHKSVTHEKTNTDSSASPASDSSGKMSDNIKHQLPSPLSEGATASGDKKRKLPGDEFEGDAETSGPVHSETLTLQLSGDSEGPVLGEN